MEAARIPWRPLGRLLVEQGLLREEELEQALADQAATGRRLGETLVELGLVSPPALSRALAEQYGIELATEEGFGTGLRIEIERRHNRGREREPGPRLVPDPPERRLAPVPEPEPLSLGGGNVHIAQLEENWARLAAAEERAAQAERELDALRRALRHREAQCRRLVRRVWRRDRRLADEAGAAVPDAVEPQDAQTAPGHILYAQLPDRYLLLEREGAAPEPGSVVVLGGVGGGAFVVEGIGGSPLPGDHRPCVLVQRR